VISATLSPLMGYFSVLQYANRQYAGDGIWPPIMVRSAEAEEVQQTAAVPPAAQLEDDDLAPDPETSAAPNSYKVSCRFHAMRAACVPHLVAAVTTSCYFPCL
jgi:hypothetical protein